MMGRFSSSSCHGNPSFAMFFSSENDAVFSQHDPYLSSSCSDYASVDCTLSLGTPSTRLNEDDHDRRRGRNSLLSRRCANCNTTSTPLWRNGPRGPKSLCNACGIRFKKEERRANAGNSIAVGRGPSAAGVPADHHYHGSASYYYDHQHYGSPWAHHQQYDAPPTHAAPYDSPAANGYWFGDDVVGDENSDVTAVPFMPWSQNVADRGGLYHDFTV